MAQHESKRARRRRDLIRMKAKARRLNVSGGVDRARHADYLAVCSCWMCGNPRRFFGETTIQEKRAFSADACERLS